MQLTPGQKIRSRSMSRHKRDFFGRKKKKKKYGKQENVRVPNSTRKRQRELLREHREQPLGDENVTRNSVGVEAMAQIRQVESEYFLKRLRTSQKQASLPPDVLAYAALDGIKYESDDAQFRKNFYGVLLYPCVRTESMAQE